MINLVTTTNGKFQERAKRLIESYFRVIPDGTAFIYAFGDFDYGEQYFIKYGEKIRVIPIEPIVSYYADPHLFFFKTFALYDYVTQKRGGRFMYLDSAFLIHGIPKRLLEILDHKTRFFVQYPRLPKFRNVHYITKRFIEETRITDHEIGAHQYWAAIQAYDVTKDNIAMIDSMYTWMQNPNIAGPSNMLMYPDGPQSSCIAHRNDQSVLSVTIPLFGFDQPYNDLVSQEYGDQATIYNLCRFMYFSGPQVISGRSS